MVTMTLSQYASRSGLHPDSVRRLIRKGKLTAHKAGAGHTAQWRISVDPDKDQAVLAVRDQGQEAAVMTIANTLQDFMGVLRGEMGEKNRQIFELHRLLAQAQEQTKAESEPNKRTWFRQLRLRLSQWASEPQTPAL